MSSCTRDQTKSGNVTAYPPLFKARGSDIIIVAEALSKLRTSLALQLSTAKRAGARTRRRLLVEVDPQWQNAYHVVAFLLHCIDDLLVADGLSYS